MDDITSLAMQLHWFFMANKMLVGVLVGTYIGTLTAFTLNGTFKLTTMLITFVSLGVLLFLVQNYSSPFIWLPLIVCMVAILFDKKKRRYYDQ